MANTLVEEMVNGSRATAVIAIPIAVTGGFMTATTAVAGATYTAFTETPCKRLTIANNSGQTVEVQQDGAGAAFPIFTGTSFTIAGIANADQIAVRRVDVSDTPVTVAARWEA